MSLTLGGPLLGFLYYGLIPSGLFGGFLAHKVSNRKLLLGIPALLNVLFGVAITVTPNPILLMFLITGLGLVWVATPAIQVLPFEFPGIRPREVAVISSLVVTFSGLGLAAGPVVTGLVGQFTGSLHLGFHRWQALFPQRKALMNGRTVQEVFVNHPDCQLQPQSQATFIENEIGLVEGLGAFLCVSSSQPKVASWC